MRTLHQFVMREAASTGQRKADPEIKEVISLHRARGPGIARLLAAPRVLIESDNGFWREDCQGYTFKATAAIYTGKEAYAATRHCGPEKRVRYHVLRDGART